MKNYLQNLPKPFLILAPMDDVTDTVFRRVVALTAPPDVFFTEFVNVDALQSAGRTAALRRLRYTEGERPIIAQIWGKNPNNFYKTAAELVEMGFDGIDINMGCPDKAVLKNQCGGALIQHPERAVEIIKAVQNGSSNKLPVSVKTRIGFREYDERWLRAVLEQKLSMLSIHLRTVREMSKVPAHWELMDQIKLLRDEVSPQTKIIGNGDVLTREQALDLAKKHQIDGVMIGRGIFHDPYLFAEQSPWADISVADKLDLYKKHVELFAQTWEEGERSIAPLNKFCKIYVSGFDGAKELREDLMSSKSIKELLQKLTEVNKEVLM